MPQSNPTDMENTSLQVLLTDFYGTIILFSTSLLSSLQQPVLTSPHRWKHHLQPCSQGLILFLSVISLMLCVCMYNTQHFSSDLHHTSAILYMQVHFSKLDF